MRLDDKFWRNKKMQRLSHAARGVWVSALSYCGDVAEEDLTGFLTDHEALERATGNKGLVAELVTQGAWERLSDGYLIHDFEHYIPRKSRERTSLWRENKRHGDTHNRVTVTQNGASQPHA